MVENLLGEPEPEAQEKGTIYVVLFQATNMAWVEIGQARAQNQRAAIQEVAGDQAGAYRAIPQQSAQVHYRVEDRRLIWADAPPPEAPPEEQGAVEPPTRRGDGLFKSTESVSDEMAGEA
jgi:hypothetical protein